MRMFFVCRRFIKGCVEENPPSYPATVRGRLLWPRPCSCGGKRKRCFRQVRSPFAFSLHVTFMSVCIFRLVRACLGPEAISERKLEAGNGLVVLGVHVFTDQTPREGYGITLWPSQDKVRKWLKKIGLALATLKLTSGEASKLSGGLQWACQMAFRRLGRAMLRPIIDQIKCVVCAPARVPHASCRLHLCLQDAHWRSGQGVAPRLDLVEKGAGAKPCAVHRLECH